MGKIRIVLADDHRLFRDGLRRLLELESDIEIAGEAKDGVEAVDLILETDPDIVLLDINMPRMDGGQVIAKLKGSHIHSKFVAITAYDDEEHLANLSALGINGYILKSSSMPDLLAALRSVNSGESYVDPKVAGKLLSSFQKHKEENDVLLLLTQREKEVLFWLSQGFNNLEISAKMVLSEKTVKNHVSHLLKKLGLNDRTQAAVLAWRMGLVHASSTSLPDQPLNSPI
ncbi:MAG: response regulator transcription factor [Synergistaceae bacterium]|jgi:DNA-binding NarL/FixJ family response regulator|nr:response regulator transcription factor [Synergistaceae bacterium]